MKFKQIHFLQQAAYADNVVYYIQNDGAVLYIACLNQNKIYFLTDTKNIRRIETFDLNDKPASLPNNFRYLEEILLDHTQLIFKSDTRKSNLW
jgi:hypothetical protein